MTHALLVVDMINDFAHPDGKLYSPNIGTIIPEVAAHVESARVLKQPIFYLCDTHKHADPEFKMFPEHATTPWGSTPVDGIKGAWSEPGPELIVPKSTFSGFHHTTLDSWLKHFQVTDLTIVGNCTDICVLFTASDARLRGYDVTVPEAAVATFREFSYHDYALKIMQHNLGVKVT